MSKNNSMPPTYLAIHVRLPWIQHIICRIFKKDEKFKKNYIDSLDDYPKISHCRVLEEGDVQVGHSKKEII